MRAVIEALSHLRLERDLSYQALAAEIGISERTVYRLLNLPKQKVNERTLFKIQRYLERQPNSGIEAAR